MIIGERSIRCLVLSKVLLLRFNQICHKIMGVRIKEGTAILVVNEIGV